MARPTAAQIRARALQQITGTTLDTAIDAAITAADQLLAEYCLFPPYSGGSRTLDKDVSTSYTLYLDGPDDKDPNTVLLQLRPIVSITSVSQDTNGDWTYSESLVENTDYTLDAERGRLLWHPNSTKPFQRGRRRIKVVCAAGFDLDGHELWMQAIAWTIHSWMPLRAAGLNVTQQSKGSQSSTLDTPRAIPLLVREMIQPFVLWERQADGIY